MSQLLPGNCNLLSILVEKDGDWLAKRLVCYWMMILAYLLYDTTTIHPSLLDNVGRLNLHIEHITKYDSVAKIQHRWPRAMTMCSIIGICWFRRSATNCYKWLTYSSGQIQRFCCNWYKMVSGFSFSLLSVPGGAEEQKSTYRHRGHVWWCVTGCDVPGIPLEDDSTRGLCVVSASVASTQLVWHWPLQCIPFRECAMQYSTDGRCEFIFVFSIVQTSSTFVLHLLLKAMAWYHTVS